MNPGDLVIFRRTDGGETPALVLEIDTCWASRSVRVLLRGEPIWVPGFSVAPMQPAADRGITLSSTGGTNE